MKTRWMTLVAWMAALVFVAGSAFYVFGSEVPPDFVSRVQVVVIALAIIGIPLGIWLRSEEHTSELQSPCNLVCRLLLEKEDDGREIGSGCDVGKREAVAGEESTAIGEPRQVFEVRLHVGMPGADRRGIRLAKPEEFLQYLLADEIVAALARELHVEPLAQAADFRALPGGAVDLRFFLMDPPPALFYPLPLGDAFPV